MCASYVTVMTTTIPDFLFERLLTIPIFTMWPAVQQAIARHCGMQPRRDTPVAFPCGLGMSKIAGESDILLHVASPEEVNQFLSTVVVVHRVIVEHSL